MRPFAVAAPFRSSYAARLTLVCGAALLVAAAGNGCRKATPPAAKPPPPTVFFTTPVAQEVQEYEEFTGRMAAANEVSIRARVAGYLDKVAFDDGTDVEQGELLFQIDDRTFQAELARAKAAVEQAEARLARLEKQAARASELFQKKVIAEEEYDLRMFDRSEAQAALDAAKAARDLAQLNVDFTRISAPLSGRISRRLVDPGNLVRADDTVLATIVSDNPIHAYFDIDERTVLRLRRLVQEGKIKAARDARVEVQISLADEQQHRHTGIVDFEDNHIDPATGTLRVRLLIDNPDRLLSPGLFVRLRFPIGTPRPALLIPEEALGSDQGRRYVYVIGEGEKVASRPVSVGILVDGLRVIESGLEPGERVVVTGLQRLKKNMPVEPRPYQPPSAVTGSEPASSATATAGK
ncbi:MAG: efflux RND transporter periplasmic adaptor subunit [Pirellulales bacterium]